MIKTQLRTLHSGVQKDTYPCRR